MKVALVIAAGLAAIVSTVALGATRNAHVTLVSPSPASINGSGFKKHERITLTVSAKSTRTKRLVAGPRGGFRTTFKGFTIGACVAYKVSAKGNRGSTALLKAIPECAPA